MEKALSLLTLRWVILFILVFSTSPTFALETEALIPQIEILTYGMTRNVEITQNYNFPQDCGHLLLLVVGYGGLSITLRKIDTEDDLVILAGLGISSAGVAPFFKFGISKVTLAEAVEIGDEHSPYGLLWILSWVDSRVYNPPYHYILALSF